MVTIRYSQECIPQSWAPYSTHHHSSWNWEVHNNWSIKGPFPCLLQFSHCYSVGLFKHIYSFSAAKPAFAIWGRFMGKMVRYGYLLGCNSTVNGPQVKNALFKIIQLPYYLLSTALLRGGDGHIQIGLPFISNINVLFTSLVQIEIWGSVQNSVLWQICTKYPEDRRRG